MRERLLFVVGMLLLVLAIVAGMLLSGRTSTFQRLESSIPNLTQVTTNGFPQATNPESLYLAPTAFAQQGVLIAVVGTIMVVVLVALVFRQRLRPRRMPTVAGLLFGWTCLLSMTFLSACASEATGPLPTSSPARPQTESVSVITVDAPRSIESGLKATINLSLVVDSRVTPLPTIGPDRTPIRSTPVPIGTPSVPLTKVFGEGYDVWASVRMQGGHATLLSDSRQHLSGPTLTWQWDLALPAGQRQPYQIWLTVEWHSQSTGQVLQGTVWTGQFQIDTPQPIIPSRPLRDLALAAGILGAGIAIPAGRRTFSLPVSGDEESTLREPSTPPFKPAYTHLDDVNNLDDFNAERVTAQLNSEPAHLNTRFDGIDADQYLPVGQRVPLVIWVGSRIEANRSQSSRPFALDPRTLSNETAFRVAIDADPEMWTIKAIEPLMLVTPQGSTSQEAEFLVTAKQPGEDKIHITVEREETGAILQHVWLRVRAEDASQPATTARTTMAGFAMTGATGAIQEVRSVNLPLGADLRRRQIYLTIEEGRRSDAYRMKVDAYLPSGQIHQTFEVPVSLAEVANATQRLRSELAKIVAYEITVNGVKRTPFADLQTLTVDQETLRQAATPLADAGWQVWHLLFGGPHVPEGLRALALNARELPEGCNLQIVIDNQRYIIPWALLYDTSGPINAQTLSWSGFWGYRYVIDVLPPGSYPNPWITDTPTELQLLLNDTQELRLFTRAQERYVREKLQQVRAEVAWGTDAVFDTLGILGDASLVYLYCHGTQASGERQAGALAGDSELIFGMGNPLRLADLRQRTQRRFAHQPLVFLNACESAARDTFSYDGFVPFFIAEKGARGFIGTEVKAPQLLAHDFALQFLEQFSAGRSVGEILWRLRRYYLDTHHTILAFNYTLYGPDEVALVQQRPPES